MQIKGLCVDSVSPEPNRRASISRSQCWGASAGDRVMTADTAGENVEEWEFDAPAHLQYWPAHVHPDGPGAWDRPRLFGSLREAIAAAATDASPTAGVAWILTSGGHILRAADVEALWLDRQAAEALRPDLAGNPAA
jgi:hypothetical protein